MSDLQQPVEHRPLRIGVSTRSLFDLEEDSKIYQRDGLATYRQRQKRFAKTPFKKGAAFAFVERMLRLNTITDDDHPLVEVAITSHMDPDTGLRVMNSVNKYHLPIQMTIFTSGSSLSSYLQAMVIDLYLSMDESAVKEALSAGLAAGHILSSSITQHDTPDGEIRLAFDFDGVIGDDASEAVYQHDGLEAFNQQESKKANTPITPGPLAPFLTALSSVQDAETIYRQANPDYHKRLKIAVITSRGHPADVRVMRTLDRWGVTIDSAFFLGGHEKKPVLDVLHPHLFFDDQLRHLTDVDYGVHIPFGVVNRSQD
jgi:5'-nucleotidase